MKNQKVKTQRQKWIKILDGLMLRILKFKPARESKADVLKKIRKKGRWNENKKG